MELKQNVGYDRHAYYLVVHPGLYILIWGSIGGQGISLKLSRKAIHYINNGYNFKTVKDIDMDWNFQIGSGQIS